MEAMCVTELPRFLKMMDKVMKHILIIIHSIKSQSRPRLTFGEGGALWANSHEHTTSIINL